AGAGCGALDMDFQQYQAIYAQWEQGQVTLQEVQQQYGLERAELLQAQRAVVMDERDPPMCEALSDNGVGQETAPDSTCNEVIPGLGAVGRPRLRFGFFESIYGQWRQQHRSSVEIAEAYGPLWVRLFRQWKLWGLEGIWVHLPSILDMEPNPCPTTTRPLIGVGDWEDRFLKVPEAAMWTLYSRWVSREIEDSVLALEYGEEWLRAFHVIYQDGIEAARTMLDDVVLWSAQHVGSSSQVFGQSGMAGTGHGQIGVPDGVILMNELSSTPQESRGDDGSVQDEVTGYKG
ncbi:Herc4, partial [Symbiodinium necroappetens]